MSDQETVSAPSYAPYITALTSIAESAKASGADSMKWAQEQIAGNKDLLDQVNKGLLDTQSTFGDAAKDRLAKSGEALDTGMDHLKDQYDKYTDPQRKAASMGAAGAQAAQADEAARRASVQELESYGVNPGSVRFGGLDAAQRLQSAATRVGAENIAGRTDDALADQTNAQILAQGNTEAGQAVQQAGTAGSAGTGAVNTGLATTASGYQGLGTGLQWTGQQTNALTGASGAQHTDFTDASAAADAKNKSSSGWGSLLGLGASAAMTFMEEGGAVPTDPAGGGAVPVEASPSNGAVTDDVPASGPGGALRLNGGEFVIPKDVVSWEGEKTLQNLILKARKAKDQAQAKPREQPAGGPDPASPAFQPRPQASPQGALPV